jgi:hypothetical protein
VPSEERLERRPTLGGCFGVVIGARFTEKAVAGTDQLQMLALKAGAEVGIGRQSSADRQALLKGHQGIRFTAETEQMAAELRHQLEGGRPAAGAEAADAGSIAIHRGGHRREAGRQQRQVPAKAEADAAHGTLQAWLAL